MFPNGQDEEALALSQLGVVDQLSYNLLGAMQHFDASRQIFEKNGDQNGVTLNLDRIGVVYQLMDKLPEARDTLRDSLTKKQALGTDRFGEACTLANLGVVEELRLNYTDAESSYQASLAIVDELRNGIARAHRSSFRNSIISRPRSIAGGATFFAGGKSGRKPEISTRRASRVIARSVIAAAKRRLFASWGSCTGSKGVGWPAWLRRWRASVRASRLRRISGTARGERQRFGS